MAFWIFSFSFDFIFKEKQREEICMKQLCSLYILDTPVTLLKPVGTVDVQLRKIENETKKKLNKLV